MVIGASRLKAARLAELESVPVRVVKLSDAEAIEAQVVENLQREDIHPLEESLGFKSLFELGEPTCTIASMLNALLAWPDHPYGFGTLYGSEFDPVIRCREQFIIAETVDLDRNEIYAKERALIEEVKAQLVRGRKCQIFAVYTHKHDVTARLGQLFLNEGIRAAILRAGVHCHRNVLMLLGCLQVQPG